MIVKRIVRFKSGSSVDSSLRLRGIVSVLTACFAVRHAVSPQVYAPLRAECREGESCKPNPSWMSLTWDI